MGSCLGSIRVVNSWRSKTDELARSSRRRTQLFLLSHSYSEDNWGSLPAPLCNSTRKTALRSVQAVRCVRIQSSSRSQNLAPNSSASEPPLSTSQADPQEDPKQSPPLGPVIVPFEIEKGLWTQNGWEEPYTFGNRTVLLPLRLRRHSTLGSDLRQGKVSLAFRLHTRSFDKNRPK